MNQDNKENNLQIISSLKAKVNTAKNDILEANNPTEMGEALNTIVNLKEFIRKAKLQSKKTTKDLDEQVKEANLLFKELEKEIKNKALATYQETIITKTNPRTSEVKQVIENNLGEKLFSYSPEKTTHVIDKEELISIFKDEESLALKHPELASIINKLVVPITTYKVDEKELAKYIEETQGKNSLPMKSIKKEASIGIQFTQILEKQEKEKEKQIEQEQDFIDLEGMDF